MAPSSGGRVAVRFHEAAVVVDAAAAGLGDGLVGARVRRIPALEAVLFEVGRARASRVAGFEQCHLPL